MPHLPVSTAFTILAPGADAHIHSLSASLSRAREQKHGTPHHNGLLRRHLPCVLMPVGSSSFLVIEDQREVGSLSRRTSSPYLSHYKAAFACSSPPLPGSLSSDLTVFLPLAGAIRGLPCSVPMTQWFRLSLRHRQCCMPMTEENGASVPTAFRACQHLEAPSYLSMLERVRICWPCHQP